MKPPQAVTLQAIALASATTAATWAAAACASEPAFDCTRAQGQVQELVCTDAALASLDRRLAEVYQTVRRTLPDADLPQLKSEQRGWIKGRDDCWKSDNVADCVTLAYQGRTVELQILTGQLAAPNTINLECGDRDQLPVAAAFYNDTTPPAVVLTRGGDQVTAFIARSGSGARYTAAGVEYWEHQGQASIDWFGTALQCTVSKDAETL
ncbi:MAG: MliC family protein [Halioglobus sp.]|nr:MliC family protein [Halioglobus sp.]